MTVGLVSPTDFIEVEESAGHVETCVGVVGTLTVPITVVITTSEGGAKGNDTCTHQKQTTHS